MNLQNNIDKIFKTRGESIFEFSNRTGFPHNDIYRYKRGELFPSLKKAMRLAELLGKSVSDIWYIKK